MVLQALAFYAFAFVVMASAAMVVVSRNPVYSVLFLILAFFNSAALFVLIGAEFIAMILVIVYVGAVAVLFLFVVMMLDINLAELREGFMKYLPVGALIGLVLLAEIVIYGFGLPRGTSATVEALSKAGAHVGAVDNTRALGRVLYTQLYRPADQAVTLVKVPTRGGVS
jgi:NADH-quinone oxidoreductase subunit J